MFTVKFMDFFSDLTSVSKSTRILSSTKILDSLSFSKYSFMNIIFGIYIKN